VFQCSCDPACDLPATGAQKSKFRRYQSVVCISIMPPPLVLTQLCEGYCRASALSTIAPIIGSIVPLEVEEQEDVEEVEVEEFEAGLIVMAHDGARRMMALCQRV